METKIYLYEDPTGGGDDAELHLPVTWEPPSDLAVRMKDGEREFMPLLGLKDEDDL